MAENTQLPAKRQQDILSYLKEKGSAQIKELADYCGVSEATVRRDLDDMAADGLLERTHGGAMSRSSTSFERIHDEKMGLMLAEKRRIAKTAAAMVEDGDSVFLDSGTTPYFVALELAEKKNLTLITNNLDIAHSVPVDPTSTVVITGGIRRENYNVLMGSTTEEFIHSLHVDIVFMGCDAVNSQAGVFNSNFMEIGVKKELVRCGKQVVLVTDHTKFAFKALTKICDLKDINVIITDKGLDADTGKEVEEAGPKLVLV